MVVHDERAHMALHHPYSRVCDHLAQFVLAQQYVKPRLPYAPGVTSSWHITRDAQEVASPILVPLGVPSEILQLIWHHREHRTTSVLQGWWCAVEVCAPNIDGCLMCSDRRCDCRDEPVGYVIHA